MCFFLPPKLTIDPSNREQQHLGVSCMERIRHHPAPPTRFFSRPSLAGKSTTTTTTTTTTVTNNIFKTRSKQSQTKTTPSPKSCEKLSKIRSKHKNNTRVQVQQGQEEKHEQKQKQQQHQVQNRSKQRTSTSTTEGSMNNARKNIDKYRKTDATPRKMKKDHQKTDGKR